MLSISTSYLLPANASGADIVKRLAALEISEVELGYGIDEASYFEIREALFQSRLQVSSVHNFFPIPSSAPKGKGGGDVFLLSHPTEDERHKAVQWTKRTIEQACAAGQPTGDKYLDTIRAHIGVQHTPPGGAPPAAGPLPPPAPAPSSPAHPEGGLTRRWS